MDDGSEGASWLGNIVQKFEDLFSGVDVSELTAVSNQLQAVLQYCRDLVEEEHPLPSERTEKDPASEIDVEDSDSSNKNTDNDHREKGSCDEYHLRCTSSTGVYEKSEVIDNENLVEEKHFQHETSVAVFPKEEEDKLPRHEMSDVVSLNEEESNSAEDASSCISSPVPSYSDHSTESCECLVLDVEVTPADPSTASADDTIAEDISHNEGRSVLQCQILEKKFEDYLCSRLVEKDPEFEKYINDYLEAKAIALPISRRQQAHITYLRQVQPHYSMMKTITQNLHGIIREEENLRASMATTQGEEFCDSDWVIV